jgi:hypothetical protein
MRKYITALALALVIANLLFWAWSHGGLSVFGWAPSDPREPQRVEEQLRPEALRLKSVNPRP